LRRSEKKEIKNSPLHQFSMSKGFISFALFVLCITLVSCAPYKVSVNDAQIIISDSTDSTDIAEGRTYKLEHPKTFNEFKVSAQHFQHILLSFKLKNPAGKPVTAHQAFITLRNVKTSQELIFVTKQDGKQATAQISLEEVASDFHGASGEYQLIFTVGDAQISNPFAWTLLNLNINFSNDSVVPLSENPFAAKPEIKHLFRVPETRPPKTISWAFTLAVLSPIAFLLIGWLAVGANISNFPFGGLSFIYAVGFEACLGAILALFALYWFQLNMVQTLLYLGVLSLPTLFFAQKNLSSIASQKVKTA